jgi:hypothetical protein
LDSAGVASARLGPPGSIITGTALGRTAGKYTNEITNEMESTPAIR